MATRTLFVLLAFTIPAIPQTAWADSSQVDDSHDVAGSYKATFQEVSNNCNDTGMSFSKATITIRKRGKKVDVKIPMVPVMAGSVSKGGKVRAKAKKGPISIRGLEGGFGVAGRAGKGTLQFIFIANFYQGKKPVCTQSWSVKGKK